METLCSILFHLYMLTSVSSNGHTTSEQNKLHTNMVNRKELMLKEEEKSSTNKIIINKHYYFLY